MFSGNGFPSFSGRLQRQTFSGAKSLENILSADGKTSLGRHREEIASLYAEPNPRMFFESLLHLAMRLEAEDRLEAATAIYSSLASGALPASAHPLPPGGRGDPYIPAPKEASPSLLGGAGERSWEEAKVPEEIQSRASQRLAAIAGTGASGLRAEFLLRRLAQGAVEPTTLLGLSAASLGFRAVRLATMSRLAGAPAANWLSRGLGARAAAGLAGFGTEAVVFPLATRLGGLALNRDLAWTAGHTGRELATSYIVLGALKLGGMGAQGLGNNLTVGARHAVPLPLFARHSLSQAGMLGGIFLGHKAEEAVGLRSKLNGATTLVDSLAMWLQSNVGGRLARGIMGERLHHWERELESQAAFLKNALPQKIPTRFPKTLAATTFGLLGCDTQWHPESMLAGAGIMSGILVAWDAIDMIYNWHRAKQPTALKVKPVEEYASYQLRREEWSGEKKIVTTSSQRLLPGTRSIPPLFLDEIASHGAGLSVVTKAVANTRINIIPIPPRSAGDVTGYFLKAGAGEKRAELIIKTKDRRTVEQIHNRFVEIYKDAASEAEAVQQLLAESDLIDWRW